MMNEFSSGLIETLPLAIFALDLSSQRLVYVNPAFIKLFELRNDTADARELVKGIDEEDNMYLQRVYDDLLLKGELPTKIELQYRTSSGKSKWLRLYPSFTDLNYEKLLTATVLDITEEMENYLTKDKYANKKNSVLNILAHDLLGPLSIANSVAVSLKKRAEDGISSQLEIITEIISQSHNIIRDLTKREFLETAEVELVKDRVDIVRTIKEYFEEYQRTSSLTKRNFLFKSSAPAIFMEVDESKFIQILNNLCSNALKFTEENASISLGIEENGNEVLFTFSDTGIGIPENLKEVLFEKHTPARRIGLQGEPSTGMGMWVIKTIIEWHEGTIWVNSKENEGTSFFFKLPKHSNK